MISDWSYIIRLVVSYPTEFFCMLRTKDVSRHSSVLKALNLILSCRDLTEVLGLRGNVSGAIGNLTSLQTQQVIYCLLCSMYVDGVVNTVSAK